MIALAIALAAAGIIVEGVSGKPLKFTAENIAAHPKGRATIEAHGKKLDCTGIWLTDLLATASVPSRSRLRGPALDGTVVAVARDGYRVTFSLGELDRDLGNAKVLIADRCNGATLGKDAPYRLVVGGDSRPTRSVRMLERLMVTGLDDVPEGPHQP